MNRKIAVIGLFCTLGLISEVRADVAQHFDYVPGGGKYTSPEVRYDLFGSLNTGDGSDLGDGHLGLGVGVNYFFNPYLGVGADTFLQKFDWPNLVNFSLLGRYPIADTGWAPYAFGGFGRQFRDNVQWTSHVGGGVEFRFNPKTGLFLDLRRTFADVSSDYTLWRLGVRFGF